jgi:hypothetical protein
MPLPAVAKLAWRWLHRIQEAQTTLYHVLWELTQQALTESSPGDGEQADRHLGAHLGDQRRPRL